MKIKTCIFYLIIFLLLNYVVVGSFNEDFAFYSLELLFVPIIDDNISIITLFFEYIFIYIIISTIVFSLYNYFHMYYYVKSRTNKNVVLLFTKNVYFKVITIIFIKIVSDILFRGHFNFSKFVVFFKIISSLLLTTSIWLLAIIILYLLLQNQKKVLFISVSFIFVYTYVSLLFNKISLFSVTSLYFINNYLIAIILKILLNVILFIILFSLSKRVEFLGGKDND